MEGIRLTNATGTVVGGPGPGEGNTVAHNGFEPGYTGFDGIKVSSVSVRLRGNAVFD